MRDSFISKLEINLPCFSATYAPYTEHVKEGWEHRHDANVLFLFYEQMIKVGKLTNDSSYSNLWN